MRYNKLINGCKDCDEEQELNNECTVTLDTSCIFYRWKTSDNIALSCLGLTAGTDLTTIIETIDQKLCEFGGFNFEGYDLGCLNDLYDVFSLQDFAESVSKEICALREGEFGYKIDTLSASIQYLNKPKLNDTCIGYSTGDTIQIIFQKLLDKVCELDAKSKDVVISPEIIVQDSETIDLTACGEKNHTLKAEVIISPVSDNKLEKKSSGLYVPALTDVDIGNLLDRINSVPALKEKLCNICSFNQGVGGSLNSNARICQCSLKIESVARYNGNNYSVVINTVDVGIAPYKWEVRNNLNIIVASGETSSDVSYLETFTLPLSTPEGSYTVRYTSLSCNCTDVKSFVHSISSSGLIAPSIVALNQSCNDGDNVIIVSALAGTNPEYTIVVRSANNQVLHTRTTTLQTNEFDIEINGIYFVTVYDSNNGSISSQPQAITITCAGTVEPPEEICVTYTITNFSNTVQTIYYTDCNQFSKTATINAEDSAVLCMIRNSFTENESLTFTEIAATCDAVCAFNINSATVVCN